MRTIRRLLYRDIAASVAFVALAFLALFYFIDFVDHLGDVGSRGRTAVHAVLASVYEVPGHLYELMPIAVLIGTIYSLARLAQSSEFTILRTGGLGPGRALALLLGLALVFAALTFAIGDYLSPWAERAAVRLKAEAQGSLRVGGAGAWLRSRRTENGAARQVSINVAGTAPGGAMLEVRIFEFDDEGRLLTRIEASRGRVDADGTWQLERAEITRWPLPASDKGAGNGAGSAVEVRRVDRLAWPGSLAPEVVASAVLPLATMSTFELWRYSTHLSNQEQAAARYQILFWKRALYPLACVVMMGLALPFAYLHARAGSVSLKVFGGIMLGIGFVLLNNLAGHIGLLRGWTPWVAAAAPGLLFLGASMAAFGWLVRYR